MSHCNPTKHMLQTIQLASTARPCQQVEWGRGAQGQGSKGRIRVSSAVYKPSPHMRRQMREEEFRFRQRHHHHHQPACLHRRRHRALGLRMPPSRSRNPLAPGVPRDSGRARMLPAECTCKGINPGTGPRCRRRCKTDRGARRLLERTTLRAEGA